MVVIPLEHIALHTVVFRSMLEAASQRYKALALTDEEVLQVMLHQEQKRAELDLVKNALEI